MPITTPKSDVTQADRDLVADFYDACGLHLTGSTIREGGGDHDEYVIRVAHHRISTRQEVVRSWQPIATARQVHGERILGPNRYGVVDTLCWNDSFPGWDDGFGYSEDLPEDERACHPEVWMPVPALPATLTETSAQESGAGGRAIVEKVETVTGDFLTEPGEPLWRIVLDGYCADFDYENAAKNFASAINRTAPSTSAGDALRAMEAAPKDGRYVLAVYKSLDGYAESLDRRAFVVRHEGETSNGYDLGWALFPGHGGVPDKCFYGWLPLPAALSPNNKGAE